MAVHFDLERMQKVKENYGRWWRHELDRPLVRVVIGDAYASPDRGPELTQENCSDFSRSPEEIIDAMDAILSREEYLGDGYPLMNFASYGPGVLAALCGARLDNSSGRVWFFPEAEKEIGEIHAVYDPESPYARRIKDIYRAGLEKWQGTVIMGIPDLGGVMDVAATLRGTENLLCDLYDEPEEVIRLVGEIEKAWYAAYEDFYHVLEPQGGNSNWSGLLCEEPSYIIQCDFCYMISGDFFRKFVLNTLKRDTKRLAHTIYHLDGIGELTHLDDVLKIPDLAAVQWVCGAGTPELEDWTPVYRKVQEAGKENWICGSAGYFSEICGKLHGSPYGTFGFPAKERDAAEKLLLVR